MRRDLPLRQALAKEFVYSRRVCTSPAFSIEPCRPRLESVPLATRQAIVAPLPSADRLARSRNDFSRKNETRKSFFRTMHQYWHSRQRIVKTFGRQRKRHGLRSQVRMLRKTAMEDTIDRNLRGWPAIARNLLRTRLQSSVRKCRAPQAPAPRPSKSSDVTTVFSFTSRHNSAN